MAAAQIPQKAVQLCEIEGPNGVPTEGEITGGLSRQTGFPWRLDEKGVDVVVLSVAPVPVRTRLLAANGVDVDAATDVWWVPEEEYIRSMVAVVSKMMTKESVLVLVAPLVMPLHWMHDLQMKPGTWTFAWDDSSQVSKDTMGERVLYGQRGREMMVSYWGNNAGRGVLACELMDDYPRKYVPIRFLTEIKYLRNAGERRMYTFVARENYSVYDYPEEMWRTALKFTKNIADKDVDPSRVVAVVMGGRGQIGEVHIESKVLAKLGFTVMQV